MAYTEIATINVEDEYKWQPKFSYTGIYFLRKLKCKCKFFYEYIYTKTV